MKATELRIGNIVEYMGKIEKVTSEILRDCDLNNAVCQPINIKNKKDDWLTYWNFVKEEYPWEDEDYMYKKSILTITVKPKGYFDFFGRQIQHVHQLQNLYFALIGEELE